MQCSTDDQGRDTTRQDGSLDVPLTWPRRPTPSAPAAARDRPWTPARLLELVTVKEWDGWMDAPSWLTASHEVLIIAVGASCGPGACLNSFFLRSCVLPTPGLPRPNSVRSADPSHRYLFIMSLSVPRNGCCPPGAAAAATSFVAPAMRLRLAGCLASWRSSVPLFGAGEVEACSTECRPPPWETPSSTPALTLVSLRSPGQNTKVAVTYDGFQLPFFIHILSIERMSFFCIA